MVGGTVRHLDWCFVVKLLDPQARNLAAPPAAGAKGDHQDGPVAQSFVMTSLVIAFALIRPRFRGTVRTGRRIADLRGGEVKAPSKPRHLVSVDQFDSRRRREPTECIGRELIKKD